MSATHQLTFARTGAQLALSSDDLDLIHDALTVMADACDNEASHEHSVDRPDYHWIDLHRAKAANSRRLAESIEASR